MWKIWGMIGILLLNFNTICAGERPSERKSRKVYYNAFSHNDYEHERPLFDALDLGFNCVEADLCFIDR